MRNFARLNRFSPSRPAARYGDFSLDLRTGET